MSKADNVALLERIVENFGGVIAYPYVRGAIVAGQECDPFVNHIGGISIGTDAGLAYRWTDLARYIRMTLGMPSVAPLAANDNHPVDVWAERERPTLPSGLLPQVIEEYALVRGEQMGVDPGGIAMAALAVCAGAIPDEIKLKVKRYDDWLESARLWVALIGSPSAKKTPIISAATKPLKSIDADMVQAYLEEARAHAALDKDTKAKTPKPAARRAILEDTTIESAQEVLRDNVNGVLLLRDELSGWFGSMEKYAGAKGGSADRAFWLEAFNGGSHTTNRVGRGTIYVSNLSVSLLGGIQPDPIRKIAAEATEDGFLQRINPVLVGKAVMGRDEPIAPVTKTYDAQVRRLHRLRSPRGKLDVKPLRFDDGAQEYRNSLEQRHIELADTWEAVNWKIGAHIRKFDSFFNRLCIVFHCLESIGDQPDEIVTEDTARRAGEFLHRYLLQHALAFYTNVLGLSDRHDYVLAVAGHILSKGLQEITVSDARRGDRIRSQMDEYEAARVLSQLEAFGWLTPEPLERNQKSPKYKVTPFVHRLFEERAEEETMRRAKIRAAIAEST